MKAGLLTRARQAQAGYNSNNELINTLDEFWGFAMLDSNVGIKVGGMYKFVGTPTAVAITTDNVVNCLIDAHLAGLAYFIADAKITTPASETKKENIVLAGYAEALSTNITMPKYDFVLRHAENEPFANYLRSNPTSDIYLFTNTGYIFLEYAKMPLSYTVGGTERAGAGGTSAGGFKFSVTGKSFTGNPSLELAVTSGSATFPKFLISESAPLNCTIEGTKGDLTVIKRTAPATATELTVTNGGYQTDWKLVNYITGVEILGTVATFDTAANKIVIPSAAAVGILPIKLIAYNPIGAKGEKLYEFNL